MKPVTVTIVLLGFFLAGNAAIMKMEPDLTEVYEQDRIAQAVEWEAELLRIKHNNPDCSFPRYRLAKGC